MAMIDRAKAAPLMRESATPVKKVKRSKKRLKLVRKKRN